MSNNFPGNWCATGQRHNNRGSKNFWDSDYADDLSILEPFMTLKIFKSPI